MKNLGCAAGEEEEEEEDQHNTDACCHGNTGQSVRHQSQYESFSMFAAAFLFVFLPATPLFGVCHAASLLEAQENDRRFKEKELCRMSLVNEPGGNWGGSASCRGAAGEGWRQLRAIQGVGWKQCRVVPGPWEDAVLAMGKSQFPFPGVEPGSGCSMQ